MLVQARATSYGLQGLRFVTRSGVRVLLDQAAGIVIDLLVALSLIALATASVMLAASARAEVQRRLGAIGVRRAVGASRAHLAGTQALEALFVAAPAATIGAIGGALATYGPTGRLLVLLNEPAPGAALAPALVVAWLASVAIPVIAAAWPAWRAAGRPPVALLRGAELGRARRLGAPRAPRAGLTVLGARLVGARRTRLIATVAALGFSTGFVLLMLALASALSSLETDPRRARQALSADRGSARLGGLPRALGPGRSGGRPALRGGSGRLVFARRDDRRDRVSGQPHGVRGSTAGGRGAA